MATTRTRGVALLVAVAMLAGACSTDDDLSLDELAPPPSESSTTTSSTTTTTASTTTTLSERDQAKAEIREVVETWFFFPRDTSKGDEGIGAQYLTGLMLYRVQENVDRITADNQVQISLGTQTMEITSIDLRLADGFADVDTCFGPALARLDATTGSTISADNPESRFFGTFQMKLTEDGWKINDFVTYPSEQGGLQRCETDT